MSKIDEIIERLLTIGFMSRSVDGSIIGLADKISPSIKHEICEALLESLNSHAKNCENRYKYCDRPDLQPYYDKAFLIDDQCTRAFFGQERSNKK
jgi:hypothetical protein